MMQQPEELLAGKKVLIVDDDARNIFALYCYLENLGMEIFTAENGLKALEYLTRKPETDLVLMDMMMPEMDGYEAIELIRKNEILRDLPVIAVTAKAMKGDREKCMEAGASEYVCKPINLAELYEKMVWLSGQKLKHDQ